MLNFPADFRGAFFFYKNSPSSNPAIKYTGQLFDESSSAHFLVSRETPSNPANLVEIKPNDGFLRSQMLIMWSFNNKILILWFGVCV